jgi:Leucine-rich repeat (LRR) protein
MLEGEDNKIPLSISTLKHLRAFKLFGKSQEMNIGALKPLSDRLETCVIEAVHLVPHLSTSSHTIYTLTKLKYLKLSACNIRQLHENISKLTSLQTLLLNGNLKLSTLPSCFSMLTTLRLLSLESTKIQSDIIASIVCRLHLLEGLQLDSTEQLTTLPSQISQLTSLQYLSLSKSKIQSIAKELGSLIQLRSLYLDKCRFLRM